MGEAAERIDLYWREGAARAEQADAEGRAIATNYPEGSIARTWYDRGYEWKAAILDRIRLQREIGSSTAADEFTQQRVQEIKSRLDNQGILGTWDPETQLQILIDLQFLLNLVGGDRP